MNFDFRILYKKYVTGRKTYENKGSINLPGALPVTVNIGLFVEEDGLNTAKSVNALNLTLLRIDSTLSFTPHKFRFMIPVSYGNEENIIRKILSCSFWKEKNPPEIQFFRLNNDERILKEPLTEEISYDIIEISPERKAFGYDPVSIAITESCSLVIIIEKECEPKDTDNKNSCLLARRYGRSVVSIEAKTGKIKEFPHDDRIFESFRFLNTYNSEKVSEQKFFNKKEKHIKSLKNDFRLAGLNEDIIEPSYDFLLPHYLKARILGTRYKFLYAFKGILISLLSAFAVFTITMQTLFFPDNPGLVWVEVAEIGFILFLMIGSRIGNFHIKWIDYNFLAERIRNAFFIRILCAVCNKKEDLPSMTPLSTPNDWMVMAFETIVSSGQPISCNREVALEPLKKFYISAWISKRLTFYETEADKARFRYHLLSYSGEILFIFTMALAIAHAIGIGHWERLFNAEISLIMAFLTITLPAFGAAISAIRVQREYHRNSERHSHIVRHLTAIKTEMKYVTSMGELCTLLKEMNEMTFREVHDWKIIFRYSNIEAV